MQADGEKSDLQKLSKSIIFGEDLLKEIVKEDNLELEHLVIVSLYRKLLEQVDGIFIIADHKQDSASKVMIRAVLETYLALKYILQVKKHIKDRAYCYYIGYVKSQHESANYIIDSSLKGFSIESTKETINRTNQILNEKKFERLLTEWEKAKAKQKINYEPKWYSLFNGPRSIKQLINKLKDKDSDTNENKLYELLSTEAHAYQALNGIETINKTMFLKPLRSENGEFHESLARSLFMSASLDIIKKIFPKYEKKFLDYAKEIDFFPSSFRYNGEMDQK